MKQPTKQQTNDPIRGQLLQFSKTYQLSSTWVTNINNYEINKSLKIQHRYRAWIVWCIDRKTSFVLKRIRIVKNQKSDHCQKAMFQIVVINIPILLFLVVFCTFAENELKKSCYCSMLFIYTILFCLFVFLLKIVKTNFDLCLLRKLLIC